MTPSGHVVDYPLSFATFPNRNRNGIILSATSLLYDFYSKELLSLWNCSSLSWNMCFSIWGELLHTDNNEKTALAGNCFVQSHMCKSRICTQLYLGFCQIYLFLHVFKRHQLKVLLKQNVMSSRGPCCNRQVILISAHHN